MIFIRDFWEAFDVCLCFFMEDGGALINIGAKKSSLINTGINIGAESHLRVRVIHWVLDL